ncbi:hypothetical protein MesoLjLc_68920 [Mesorhizobium sp. L-8-10]|nr:hypothetical protein MesoLjLc_68920 [Mesorhizobium sp. L-8-10]
MHFARNVLAHAGKSGRGVVSAFIATAFAQETLRPPALQWRAVADQIRPKAEARPAAAALVGDLESRGDKTFEVYPEGSIADWHKKHHQISCLKPRIVT